MTDTELYLQDVLGEFLEHARGARADYLERRSQAGEVAAQFEAGRALAYYEVVSHALAQLQAFGIDRRRVGVSADLNVERELL